MTDIVERLRYMADKSNVYSIGALWNACDEAADQIEGLRDEIRNAYRERDEASRDWEQAMRRIAELEAQRVPDATTPKKAERGFCPECGSDQIRHQEREHKQCARCGQEWFSDVDYSGVVRQHLADLHRLKAELAALTATGGRDYDASIQDEIVSRVLSYAGKKRNEVRSPHLTAREAIALADWITTALTATGGRDDSPEERFNHYLQTAIDSAPDPLRRLGEYLTSVLDEDRWPAAERLLNGACVAVATGGRDEYVRGVKAMATEAKQLCRDFSDLRDRPYMSDVTVAIDALAEQVAAAQPAQEKQNDD